MTIKDFFDLINGFGMDAKLYMSGKSNISMVENAVPVEKVVVDYDEKTKEMRIIVG